MKPKDKKIKSADHAQSSYAASLTIHGLSKALTGHPIERIFWLICLSIITSITIYLCRNFYLKYAAFDIRTDIKEAELTKDSSNILIICTNVYNELNCFGNRTLIGSQRGHCYSNSTNIFSKPYIEHTIDTRLRNCAVVKASISEKISFFMFWNGFLSIYLAKSDYLSNISDIVYHSALPMFYGNVHYSFSSTNIMIEKSVTKKRLPAPYPSNCTFGAGIEDFF